MPELVLASNNAKKLAELQALLPGIQVRCQGELGVGEAEEPHGTFVENALAKARHAARITGRPALADDSGLCVDALQGRPGVQSARYAALAGGERSDAANNALLLATLQGQADRRAHFACVLVALRHADDPQPLIAQGRWLLEVLAAPRGEGGFGYDPLVAPRGQSRSVAQMSASEKNTLSHRAQAMAQLRAQLAEAWGWR
ncbi:RdgB/HAM1 family non-canonical purine NTP pyrophosphatase [Inhella proteolytica]|uniref:dITP/XTP pyrophosphatase n=1 Tax=Inhella proteolytica TaxID=2795029 RepID=A0A931J372_9BURK|nr:RdgB/HAM1 family non-canonical purine NTP pyrophosphatase [Inhella proteolytica]MBH9578721.1 RdgB/HAM1 family non-canonical purine NTP pyrophosphatase [Inhella proteolytica]